MHLDVYTERLPKNAEIFDESGNLWFTVTLMRDELPPGANEYDEFYRVIVVNNRHPDGDILIVEYPVPPQRLADFGSALRKFREYVDNYRAVVKASIRDVARMDVYADKVGYKHSEAKCCASCQFCRRVPVVDDWYYGITGKLECWNPENRLDYFLDVRERAIDDWHHIIGQPRPEHVEHRRQDVRPQVEPLDVCEHYLKRTRPLEPVPGQSMSEFVDMRMGHRLDARISTIISSQISGDQIIEPVLCAVTMILSAPESSVLLEAPVVNLMNGSELVQGATIDVVGNAICCDVLSSQLLHSTETSLQQPEISAYLIDPVSAVIPSEQVSGVVAETAANGNKISAIDGGDDQKDDDGDGKPDPIPTTIVWGGLGA